MKGTLREIPSPVQCLGDSGRLCTLNDFLAKTVIQEGMGYTTLLKTLAIPLSVGATRRRGTQLQLWVWEVCGGKSTERVLFITGVSGDGRPQPPAV